MLTKPGILSAEDITINDIPLNTIDDNSVAWMVTDLEGWWGLPDLEVPDDPRPFSQDGSYYTTGRFTSRLINLKGYILPVDGVADKSVSTRNAFNRALVLVRNRAVLKVREEGIVKTSLVQIASRPLLRISRSTGLLEFDISLKATDPVKYGDYVNILNMFLSSSNTGRVYDRSFNFSYGGASISEELEFYQDGSYWSYPEMTITGPIVDPMVALGDGRFLRFKTTLGPGEELKVVNFTEEVSKGGQNVINTLTRDSRWFNILPGPNLIRFRGTQHIPSREHMSIQTNFALNPVPLGTVAGTLGATFRENTVRNPEPSGSASSHTITNMGIYTLGTSGAGTTMTSDTPVDVTVRTNLVRNPSIETNTTGYGSNLSTITREGGWAGSGEYSLKNVPTSTTDSTSYVKMGVDSSNVDTTGGMTFFQAGKTYTASCTVRIPFAQVGPLNGAARTLLFYSQIGSSGYVSQNQPASTAPNSPGTYRISNTFTVPVSATQAFIRPVNGARAYTVSNYNTNPSVENNTTGYTAQAGSGITISRTTSAVAAPIRVGTNVLRITTTGVSSTSAYVFNQATMTPAAGSWIGAGINMRRSTGPTHARITFDLYTSGMGGLVSLNSPVFEIPSGSGGRQTFVAQVPGSPVVGIVRTVLRFYQDAAGTIPASNGNIDTDAWSLVMSSTQADAQWQADNYFDGASSDLNGWNYTWAGTSHASVSNGTHDQSIYFDEFMIEESPTLGEYFDGDSAGVEDPILVDTLRGTSWTGTSHASTSVEKLILSISEGGPVAQGGPAKFARHLITTTKTGSSSGFHSESAALRSVVSGVAGDDVSVSGWVRYSGPASSDSNHRVRLRIQPMLAGAVAGSNYITDYVVLPHDQWVRMAVGGPATATFDAAQFYVIIDSGNAMPAYSTLDVAGFVVEKTKLQSNLVKNPSFETGLQNYTGNVAGLAQSDEWSETGTYSLEITPTGASTDSCAALATPDTGLTTGRFYRASGTIYKPATKVGSLSTYTDRVSVRWSGGETNSPVLPNEPGVYRVATSFIKTASITSTRLYCGSNNSADKVYWDDFAVQEVAPNPALRRTNRIDNPRLVGQTVTNWAGGAGTQTDEVTGGPLGFGYRKTVMTTANTTSPMSVNPYGTGTSALSAKPNTDYSLSAYLLASGVGSGKSYRIELAFYNSSGSLIGAGVVVQTSAVVDGTWVRLSGVATSPAGTAYVRPTIIFSGAGYTIGSEIGYSAFMLEESSSVGAYFDGSIANTSTAYTSWGGAVNSSVSYQDPTDQGSEYFEVDEDNTDKFYFDGDSVSKSTSQIIWSGPRGNSVSYKVPSFFSGNMPGTDYRNARTSWSGTTSASNSIMRLNMMGWDSPDTSLYLSNEDINRVRRPGTQSISVQRLDVAQNNLSIAKVSNIGASGSALASQPSVTGLTRVASSVYCYTEYEHASVVLTMEYLNASGNVLSTVTNASATPLSAGVWTRAVLEDSTDRNASATRIRLTAEAVSTDEGTSSHIGQIIYFQDAKIGLADYALEPYFDGSFQYAQWNGTAHNSSSTVPSEVTEILPASLEVRIRDAWIE